MLKFEELYKVRKPEQSKLMTKLCHLIAGSLLSAKWVEDHGGGYLVDASDYTFDREDLIYIGKRMALLDYEVKVSSAHPKHLIIKPL